VGCGTPKEALSPDPIVMEVLHSFKNKRISPQSSCILPDIQMIEICQERISNACVIEAYFSR